MDAARFVVDALEVAGVRHVVLCPGSRSAPLAYALAEAEADGRLRCHVRIDERVAGFMALGLAQGGGVPSAVVTTSGTAVGNLMPAVMEANHSGTPLLVLSADRPEELRGTGANQTTAQFDLFGDHVRFATDVEAGTDPRGAISTAVSAARGRLDGVTAGPVQVNLAFRDPLMPALDGSEWERLGTAPLRVPIVPEQLPADSPVPAHTHRTVVVAGDSAGPEAELFARLLGLPLLAEPSSNARFGPNAIGPYRLLLEQFGATSASPIERVVVFGRPTLSRPVAALLADPSLERALYVPRPVPWFEPGRRTELILTQWEQLIGFAGAGPDGWLHAWQAAEAGAEEALEVVLSTGPLSGPAVARAVWHAASAQKPAVNLAPSNLVLGSSNPVRDVDLAGQPGPESPAVYANRGLAGIDGTIATATGIALATAKPTRVLLGDVTFLHDVGSLLSGNGEEVPDLQLVVLNDGGGGIFEVLEHGTLAKAANYAAAVERFFGTPHSVNLGALALAYGWEHTLIGTLPELKVALAEPIVGRRIIEIQTSRAGLRDLHAKIRTVLTP